MWGRIAVIMRKELLQVLREPRMRMVLIGPPLLQLIIFGYAVNLDVVNSELAWWDQDRSAESRELLARFEGSTYFTVSQWPVTQAEIDRHLDTGSVSAAIIIPPGFGTDLRRGRSVEVQVLLDGTDSNTAGFVATHSSQVLAQYGLETFLEDIRAKLVSRREPLSTGAFEAPVRLESRVWFNPSLVSQDFFVPGVVVNIIGLVTVMLTAMAVVREKELGTMEQLMVTPVRPFEVMLGKTLPFAGIGLIEMGMVTGAAWLLFDIPFRGSLALLIVCTVLFLGSTLGAGLLVSTLSDTQQQAMMGSFFFFLPTFMLSGFVFPIRNMPEPVQYLTYLNVVRYFIEIVRGIFLKGTGMDILWPQMLALGLFGCGMIVISALRFNKRLD